MGINTSFGAGGVKVSPKAVMPTTSDILGMMPQRVTQSRPETAGMEELGTMIAPGLAKAVAPVGKGYLSLLGNEINAGLTGQPTRSVIGQMTPKPLQIFIGNNSKAFNTPAAETYLKMEKTDATPEQMWEATGTFRGVDGKLRQEISDVPAQLLNKQKNFEGKLHETLSHPELFKNYPALQYYDTDITSQIALPEHLKKTLIGRGSGSFTQKDFVTGEPKITAQAYSDEDKKVLLHELQHAVQAKEGFARGGSPGSGNNAPFVYGVGEASQKLKQIESLLQKTPYNSPEFDNLINQQANLTKQAEAEAAFEGYRRLAGEAEARATETRMNLTDEERRAKFPYESYDVPKSNLIVRKP
jgi:ABC-type transport system substrate-binding protein